MFEFFRIGRVALVLIRGRIYLQIRRGIDHDRYN